MVRVPNDVSEILRLFSGVSKEVGTRVREYGGVVGCAVGSEIGSSDTFIVATRFFFLRPAHELLESRSQGDLPSSA